MAILCIYLDRVLVNFVLCLACEYLMTMSDAVFTEHPADHESVCRSGDMCRGTFLFCCM